MEYRYTSANHTLLTGSKETAKNSVNLRSSGYLPFDDGGGCWECWFLEKKHSKPSRYTQKKL